MPKMPKIKNTLYPVILLQSNISQGIFVKLCSYL